jgi:hypothetical protein
MSLTCTQLAYQALRDLSCLRPGQTTSTDVLNDILVQAQQMIDSWLLEPLLVPFIRLDDYALTINQQSYTIGPGGNLNTTRPTQIETAALILNNVTPNVRLTLEVINVQSREMIPVDAISNSVPRRLYYDKAYNASGLGNIFIWPGPLLAYLLELGTWQQIQNFADLTTVYNFPPGYSKLLRKGLAKTIAPSMRTYAKVPGPGGLTSYDPQMLELVIADFTDAKEKLESYNAPDPIAPVDEAWSSSSPKSGWNYLSDTMGNHR